ncbi:F-box/LRR-repeat protein At5g38396-like isoform X2 [Arabidopsis lyrata subsp. lyrata]|nr:F-box/LRR-repeat protein At5g38396-like isoform X2 [Arabidopsis lyrata subsp. lyrata]|eukprot:XP_020874866.1 F-box/LRR-repeat protein At5g38396-like isoform X2 [Arabidopsis lyrata subsp. lyrata]
MDLLSKLPDEVLCHTLSFLTTKEAAVTSVLSKRWRNLLAFVSNLHIDDSVFLHPEEGKRDRNEIRQSFVEFVDRILALQGNSPIKKVSLKCLGMLDAERLDDWISNVLVRGVSELDLSISFSVEEYILMSTIRFESKNLVKLKLHNAYIGCQIESELLPMLKTLVLESARFFVDYKSFLSAFAVLENLVLVDVFGYYSSKDVTVSNASLKTLTMNSNHFTGILSFDTPSLGYFSYSDYVAKDYPLVKMENLLEARISLLVTEDQIERAREPNNDGVEDGEDDVVLRFGNVGKLMNGIRNVQYIDLSANTLEVLSLCCESMPVFKKLKSLSIKSEESRGWQAMPVLLRNSPHLETLVLEGLLHYVTDKCGDACDCVTREEKGRSLTSCPVKVLEIKRFQGTMKEMHMIKHFLDYFPRLKEIKIYIDENSITPEVSKVIAERMELYNKLSNCNVQLLVS